VRRPKNHADDRGVERIRLVELGDFSSTGGAARLERMPDPSRLALFVGAALALLAVPGPAVLYIVTQSIGGGRRAGLMCTLGIHTGTLVHVTAATVGLSALLASSALAFDVVKYLGGAYLVVVGVRRLLGLDRRDGPAAPVPRSRGSLYRQGIVVNVLNPKTALFFLAFLPQFVDPSRGTPWVQILALGLLFSVLGVLSDATWALVAGTLGERLRHSTRFPHIQRYVSGTVFVGLGAVAAFTAPVRRA
jgi:threonine/homoserine/homoserine lactone efflux protein